MPKKAPEALICKASGCGSKTEKRWNRVEQKLEHDRDGCHIRCGRGDPSTPLREAQGCRPFSAENEHTGSFSGRSEPQDDTLAGMAGCG